MQLQVTLQSWIAHGQRHCAAGHHVPRPGGTGGSPSSISDVPGSGTGRVCSLCCRLSGKQPGSFSPLVPTGCGSLNNLLAKAPEILKLDLLPVDLKARNNFSSFSCLGGGLLLFFLISDSHTLCASSSNSVKSLL